MAIKIYEDVHLFDQLVVYGDICTNHHGVQELYEKLVMGLDTMNVVPKIQLFSPETFNRSWPIPKIFAASVFRPGDIDFIMKHNPLALKVASVESTHLELIKLLTETEKPLIISTGGMDDSELLDLLDMVQGYEPGICLMHCVSKYPTPLAECNMLRITTIADAMEEMLMVPRTGWSCHTGHGSKAYQYLALPVTAALTQGASQYEFHVSTEQSTKTEDEQSSLSLDLLSHLLKAIKTINELLGNGDVEQSDREDVLKWRKRWQGQ